MKITIQELSIGSRTADEKLLEELDELSMKLDSESDELLATFSSGDDYDETPDFGPNRSHFGIIYAKDLDTDKAVGYLRYTPSSNVYRIDGLYVEKEYRRHCIGYCLMRNFNELCQRQNVAKVNLGCIASNKSAIEFYMNEGYRISDATYILSQSSVKNEASKLQFKEKLFCINEFDRVWNEMKSFLNKEINLEGEVDQLRAYYMQNKNLEPVAICSIDRFECAVLGSKKDSELYVIATNIPPEALTKDFLDGMALAFLQYARTKKMKQVCIADIHLPFDLGRTSDCWKEVGYTFFKLASDFQPRKSNLRI